MSVISKKAVTARVAGQKERQVFKHALAKPYTITWPSVKQAVQEEIIDALCEVLQPVSAYFSASRRASKQIRRIKVRKQYKMKHKKKGGISDRPNVMDSKVEISGIPCIADKIADNVAALRGQVLLKHLVLGINGTTRALEKQARRESSSSNSESNIALVVACKMDIESHVVGHLPALAHAARTATASISRSTKDKIEGVDNSKTKTADAPYQLRLVGVAKGAEKRLAAAICQRRMSVIGIRPGVPELDRIIRLAQENVSAPSVPWIGSAATSDSIAQGGTNSGAPVLHPMSVHELHTTAPVKEKKATRKDK